MATAAGIFAATPATAAAERCGGTLTDYVGADKDASYSGKDEEGSTVTLTFDRDKATFQEPGEKLSGTYDFTPQKTAPGLVNINTEEGDVVLELRGGKCAAGSTSVDKALLELTTKGGGNESFQLERTK
ncbi:hypothetical protein [Nocardia arthritidis]|uniref:Uncharacterized protein n=1 Tax=Nocardia arthritidis TaxID=228602 RepID=A0A6G9YMU9_9NOCA|nr:hypothetical protein [Nocardia arthritidis]QIS14511.1 hypothetical protein F5544_33375 [Nocardia arthritidis]